MSKPELRKYDFNEKKMDREKKMNTHKMHQIKKKKQ